MESLRRQMVTRTGSVHTFAYQLAEIHLGFVFSCLFVARPPGAQHLLYGLGEAIGIAQHELVELLSLRVGQFAPLQRLQVEADGSHRRLQLMSYGIDEAVV